MQGRMGGAPALYVAGGLLTSVVILSVVLAWMALRRERVLVVPGVRDSQVILAGEIPDAAAVKFAHLYLAYFDDFTPETVEERSTFVLRQVAPELAETVRRELTERAIYAVRTRESSQLVLVPPTPGLRSPEVERLAGGLLRVSARGERRTFIASELKGTSRVHYTVTLRPRLPADQDAYGFEIVGQTIRTDDDGKSKDAGSGVRHE